MRAKRIELNDFVGTVSTLCNIHHPRAVFVTYNNTVLVTAHKVYKVSQGTFDKNAIERKD